MILTTVSAALLTQLPGAAVLPEALEPASIELVIQATENHFSVENLSAVPQVLVIGEAQFGATGALRVEPGEMVVYPFPRGAADDMLFEVVALGDSTWRNTGALTVGDVRRSDQGAMWIQGSETFSIGWIVVDQELVHAAPVTGLLPAGLVAGHSGLEDYETLASTHVPVPLPIGDKKGDGPPVVDDEVLPAV